MKETTPIVMQTQKECAEQCDEPTIILHLPAKLLMTDIYAKMTRFARSWLSETLHSCSGLNVRLQSLHDLAILIGHHSCQSLAWLGCIEMIDPLLHMPAVDMIVHQAAPQPTILDGEAVEHTIEAIIHADLVDLGLNLRPIRASALSKISNQPNLQISSASESQPSVPGILR